ncbi:hypothetical protein BDV93DRAFT_92861 [Ceratobasidium sp. AG-I]|nr:hypothetical protein BDV93DRAFT_92861 [Ceratobasidium sp. AG-I]
MKCFSTSRTRGRASVHRHRCRLDNPVFVIAVLFHIVSSSPVPRVYCSSPGASSHKCCFDLLELIPRHITMGVILLVI